MRARKATTTRPRLPKVRHRIFPPAPSNLRLTRSSRVTAATKQPARTTACTTKSSRRSPRTMRPMASGPPARSSQPRKTVCTVDVLDPIHQSPESEHRPNLVLHHLRHHQHLLARHSVTFFAHGGPVHRCPDFVRRLVPVVSG